MHCDSVCEQRGFELFQLSFALLFRHITIGLIYAFLALITACILGLFTRPAYRPIRLLLKQKKPSKFSRESAT
jgi:hypothetical protein